MDKLKHNKVKSKQNKSNSSKALISDAIDTIKERNQKQQKLNQNKQERNQRQQKLNQNKQERNQKQQSENIYDRLLDDWQSKSANYEALFVEIKQKSHRMAADMVYGVQRETIKSVSDKHTLAGLAIKHLKELTPRITDPRILQAYKSGLLGKDSPLTKAISNIKTIYPIEERKKQGRALNLVYQNISQIFEKRQQELAHQVWKKHQQELVQQVFKKKPVVQTQHSYDVTLESRDYELGTMHPISVMCARVNQVLQGLGFQFIDAPYIDDVFYNFDALNMPINHPARQEICSFYLQNNSQTLLRTHATNTQIHRLEKNKQPCKIFNTGQVFRNDSDKTHNPVFHQNDVLCMGEDVSMQDLISMVRVFLSQVLHDYPNLRLRIRPSYFPFTEPSAEVDIWTNNQWLEIMGCGMMHPNVFRALKIDPIKMKGYAWGVGIDRLAMLVYGITDIRQMLDSDYRWIKNFGISTLP